MEEKDKTIDEQLDEINAIADKAIAQREIIHQQADKAANQQLTTLGIPLTLNNPDFMVCPTLRKGEFVVHGAMMRGVLRHAYLLGYGAAQARMSR